MSLYLDIETNYSGEITVLGMYAKSIGMVQLVRPNISPEGLGQGFRDGFMMDFRDEAARDAYLIHPEHQAAGAKLVAALEGGIGGLIVFDIRVG